MITNDLTHGIAFENLAHEDEDEEVNRPRSGSLPVVQFAADDSDHSDKEVGQINGGLFGKRVSLLLGYFR